MRYLLARKVGFLGRASGRLVSPSAAASRPLSSGSHQDGYSNNGAGVGGVRQTSESVEDLQKQQAEFAAQCEAIAKVMRDQERKTSKLVQDLRRQQAELATLCEAIEKAVRDRERDLLFAIGSFAAGFGLGLLIITQSAT